MPSLDDLTSQALETDFHICAALERADGSKSAITNHAVFLVHGIHDPAEWQESLSRRIEETAHMKGVPLKYGYFDVIRFLFFRAGPAEKFETEFKLAIADPNIDQISIIAHSFGTYVVAKTLKKHIGRPLQKLRRLILCGSIIKDNYDWGNILQHVQHKFPIINDCGIKDYWPMWAQFTGLGFGATGRLGFGCYMVIDRFHDMGHGGFFNEKFIDEYWIPLLTSGTVKDGIQNTPPPSKLLSIIITPFFQLKTILILTGIAFLLRNWPWI